MNHKTWLLLFTIAITGLVAGSCSREPVSTQGYVELILRASFAEDKSGLQKTTDPAIIDRVVVTVRGYSVSQDTAEFVGDIVVQQPLTIVVRPTGRFAEGKVAVPLKGDITCFIVTVDAFDAGILTFSGTSPVCFDNLEGRRYELPLILSPVVPPNLQTDGGDVVVLGDVHMLGDSLTQLNFYNQVFAENLVTFTNAGANASLTDVKIYTGHNGDRLAANVSLAALFTAWRSLGYNPTQSSETPIQTQGFKVIMIFLPGQNAGPLQPERFDSGEITALRQFMRDGGRLVLVAESANDYSVLGRQSLNLLLTDLGVGILCTNTLNVLAQPHFRIAPDQVTTGVFLLYTDGSATFAITDAKTAAAAVMSEANPDDNDRTNIIVAVGRPVL